MKPKFRNLLLVSATLLSISQSHADTLYWDGGIANIATPGNGLSGGTLGNWNTTLTNWDQGSGLAHINWTNGTNTAFFGGTAGNVTLTAPITVGGLGFSSNSGYTITAGIQGLTFDTGTNHVRMINVSGTTSTATISGTVAGGASSNLVFTSIAPDVASTLTFNGTSAGGWSGTTTINPSMTVSLAASNQALLNTSGITLNGGNILLTNTATGSENTINRVSDTAAISSYGSGSISIANTSTAGRQYSETIGSITHNNGQLNVGFTTIQNGTAPSTQTLMVGGLTRSGTTSTIAINGGGSGAGAIHGNSFIRVNGITTDTAANEIIGPCMTAGTAANAQSDWAVYDSDGISGRIVSRGIAASAQTTWTSSLATGNYTAANTNPLTSTVNNTLTADRYVNTLRATFSESNAASHTMDSGTNTITFAGHALTDGDVVTFRAAGGLTDTRPYYVINSVAATSFQLSLTPGGPLFDLTSDTEGFIATGLNLNGNTLGMNGYITGTTGSAAIGGGSASTITLATATSGNLYLHGANNIWIDPSIKDNGAGALTLVKSGTNTVTLSGANTYTGGTQTVLGGSIGASTTSARINVAGNATTNAAAVRMNIYGNEFSATTDGTNTYTLIQGGGTNTLNNATYTLGTVFNASNFTVGAISKSANDVTVAITAATALPNVYWKGTATAGLTQIWAASNGSTTSNWTNTDGGTVQSLVPGSGANVFITGNSLTTNPTATRLGADMSINSLTISNTAVGLGLNGDGSKLTIGAGGITMDASVPNSTIGANVALGASQTWTNNSNNTLTVSGAISGGNTLNKAGDGTLILTSALNTHTGATNVNDGILRLNGTHTGGGIYTVGVNGTLQGTGSTTSALNVSGVLSPGASVETFASGTLSQLNGSTFEYEVDSSVATSSGADLQIVNGDFNLSGTVNLTITDLALADISFADGTTFTLINYSGNWNNGLFTYDGNLIADGGYFTAGLNSWQLFYDATSGGLNFDGQYVTGSFVNITAAIPEPSTALLGALGLLALLRRRR